MAGGDTTDQDQLEQNRRFKKSILDAVFQHCETFYLHCMAHPKLSMGRRGLTEREETEGIILVFGPYSTKNLSWDDQFIYCELQFSRWETVSIPFECIARIFDKGGQVIMQWATLTSPDIEKATGERDAIRALGREDEADSFAKKRDREKGEAGDRPDDSRVIQVDFRNRRAGNKSDDPKDET